MRQRKVNWQEWRVKNESFKCEYFYFFSSLLLRFECVTCYYDIDGIDDDIYYYGFYSALCVHFFFSFFLHLLWFFLLAFHFCSNTARTIFSYFVSNWALRHRRTWPHVKSIFVVFVVMMVEVNVNASLMHCDDDERWHSIFVPMQRQIITASWLFSHFPFWIFGCCVCVWCCGWWLVTGECRESNWTGSHRALCGHAVSSMSILCDSVPFALLPRGQMCVSARRVLCVTRPFLCAAWPVHKKEYNNNNKKCI